MRHLIRRLVHDLQPVEGVPVGAPHSLHHVFDVRVHVHVVRGLRRHGGRARLTRRITEDVCPANHPQRQHRHPSPASRTTLPPRHLWLKDRVRGFKKKKSWKIKPECVRGCVRSAVEEGLQSYSRPLRPSGVSGITKVCFFLLPQLRWRCARWVSGCFPPSINQQPHPPSVHHKARNEPSHCPAPSGVWESRCVVPKREPSIV